MQLRVMILCLLALGVMWIAMSSGPPIDAPHPLEQRSAARSCKTCKDRAWCGCTRDGKPRTSCDPCCYQGPNDPLPVCVE